MLLHPTLPMAKTIPISVAENGEPAMSLARRTLLVAALLLPTTAAFAQSAPIVTRIRGTVVGFADATLTVATREGPNVSITLPGTLAPSALKRMSMTDIKPNSFIATVAAPDASGTLQASYVMIFPEAMRGTGEGHYDWDLAPGTSMTNATVASIGSATAGHKLALVYKNTPIEISVPDNTPILSAAPASRDDLRPGVHVFIVASKADNGSLTANRVYVGKDGVNPPQ